MAGYIGASVVGVVTDGSDVTGNITVGGTVDSRDVSVDGAKLDTIPVISTSSVPSFTAKSDGTTDGYIQLNCSANSHGIKLKSPPHSAGASYTLVFPVNDGDSGQFLRTDGSGVLSWGTDATLDNTKLPLAGGAMTGAITTNSTFDGVDVGARDAVLTDTTTKATVALPKTGGAVTGNVTFGDGNKAIFGAGSDLQIYHDGNNRLVTSGDLLVNIPDGDEFQVLGSQTASLRATATGSVRLFYNGAEKLATTNTGINITGTLTSDGFTVDGNARIEELGAIAKLTLERGGSANNADSAAVDLLETNAGNEGANFADAATNGFRLKLDGSANDFLIQSGAGTTVRTRFGIDRDTGDISFYEDTGTTAKLFWDASAESLGIGTSAPSTKIQVTGDSSSRNTIVSNVTLDGGTSVANPYQGFGFGINFIGRDYGNAVRNYASINTVMEAKSSSSGGGDAGFKTGLGFYTNGGGASGTNPTEAMRIHSSGNLLVGTTSTDLATTSSETGAMVTDGSFQAAANNPVAQFNRITTPGTIVNFRINGSPVGSIGGSSNILSIVGKDGNGGIAIQNNNFGDIIYPASNTSGGASSGAIDLGYNNGRWKDLYLSGGVNFGAATGQSGRSVASPANTLSDYEFGSWTPTIAGGTCNVNSALYVRVGNQVTITFYINNVAPPANTTLFLVAGLPFSVASYAGNYSAIPISYWGSMNLTGVSSFNTGHNGAVNMYLHTSNHTAVALTNNDIIASGSLSERSFIVGGTYITNQ